jgi:hypothetical protein
MALYHMTVSRDIVFLGYVVTDVELSSQLLLCVMPSHHLYLDMLEEDFIPAMMVNPMSSFDISIESLIK